jgi:hypothetical protein
VYLLLNVIDYKIVHGKNKTKFAKAQQAKATTTTTTKRKSPSIPTQIFGLTKCVKLEFSGAFAKLRKSTMSFMLGCTSVCPSVWNSPPTRRTLMRFHIRVFFFQKSVEKIKVSLKSDKNNR